MLRKGTLCLHATEDETFVVHQRPGSITPRAHVARPAHVGEVKLLEIGPLLNVRTAVEISIVRSAPRARVALSFLIFSARSVRKRIVLLHDDAVTLPLRRIDDVVIARPRNCSGEALATRPAYGATQPGG